MAATIVNRRNKIHPWKFALWLGCGSITMMFAAWTSAYVVRQNAGNWLEYKMPNIFFLNTAVLLLSSVALHFSYLSFKREKEGLYKGLLVLAMILGLSFVGLQYLAWRELYDIGVYLTGTKSNAAGQFMYVFTSFHAAHVLGGVAVLVVAMVHAFSLPFKPTPKRKLRFELTLTYWHFVDFLWIYLFSFFLLQM
jgi:cytochrome c oxidase subunit III